MGQPGNTPILSTCISSGGGGRGVNHAAIGSVMP